MSLSFLTDAFVEKLRAMQKIVENPRARQTSKLKHFERNFDIVSTDRSERFTVFMRQSTLIPNSFSAGLRWHSPRDGDVILTRYNGGDHPHRNPLEGEDFAGACHIHLATERYVLENRKTEHFAERTQRYADLAGALQCLAADWCISGFKIDEDSGQGQLL